jgi:hypothetical protein
MLSPVPEGIGIMLPAAVKLEIAPTFDLSEVHFPNPGGLFGTSGGTIIFTVRAKLVIVAAPVSLCFKERKKDALTGAEAVVDSKGPKGIDGAVSKREEEAAEDMSVCRLVSFGFRGAVSGFVGVFASGKTGSVATGSKASTPPVPSSSCPGSS